MNCALCGGAAASPYLKAGGHILVECAGCGLVRTEDFVRPEYREEYFSGADRYVARWDEFLAMSAALIAKVRRFRRSGVLLDIGAGAGALMAAAAGHGFTVKGVETSAWAAAYARKEKGLDVFHGTLAEAGPEKGSFDVAVLNHVLEHEPAPLELLAGARSALKDDGLLVVGAPNIGSIMARLRGAAWRSLRPDEHVWHFSRRTLSGMLERAGFEPVYFEARENYPVKGRGPVELVKRSVNFISELAGRSEAMLIFAEKRKGPEES